MVNPAPHGGRSLGPSRLAFVWSVPVTSLMLSLLYCWFAVADRHVVFLYYHDMGPRVPDTAPNSFVTSSRFWMAGLVASGTVLVLYTAATLLASWLRRSFRLPAWWRVWL